VKTRDKAVRERKALSRAAERVAGWEKEEKRTDMCVDIGSEGSLELDRNKGADSTKEWTALQSTNLPVPCP
jgi:hypothetical protein